MKTAGTDRAEKNLQAKRKNHSSGHSAYYQLGFFVSFFCSENQDPGDQKSQAVPMP